MATELYFVRDALAPCIHQAGIPILPTTLTGRSGVLFPAQHRAAAIAALRWLPDETAELITSDWSVEELTHSDTRAAGAAAPMVRLEVHDEPSAAWREYLERVRTWCGAHPQPYPVAIHYTSGTHDLSEHGCLHLCFGGCADFAIRVWAHDRDIFYQRAHFWVGELGPEHDHCRHLIPTLLSEFLPRIMGLVPEDHEHEFAATFAGLFDEEEEVLAVEIAKHERATRKLQQELVAAVRALDALENRRADMRRSHGERQEHLRQECLSLARREYIRSLHVAENTITVITDHVLIENSEAPNGIPVLYDIGAFRIDLFTDGRDGCVKIQNLKRLGPSPLSTSSSFHHPHVTDRGAPCLGTIKHSLPRLIARQEYAAACDLLINFLRSVNPVDTYGRDITRWPHFSKTKGASP